MNRSKWLRECGVAFGLLVVLAAIAVPVYQRSRKLAKQSGCYHVLRSMTAALDMYAREWDGEYPLSDDWPDAIRPYMRIRWPPFTCPAVGGDDEPVSYAMAAEPGGTLVFWDVHPLTGEPAFRHDDGICVAHADRHVTWMTAEEFGAAIGGSADE